MTCNMKVEVINSDKLQKEFENDQINITLMTILIC